MRCIMNENDKVKISVKDTDMTIEATGITVENGTLVINNPNFEVKGNSLLIHNAEIS